MNKRWQLQEAKSKFSRLVDDALTEGPQYVTKRGVESVVVLSAAEYRKLLQQQGDLFDFFRSAPRVDLNNARSADTGRSIPL